MPRVHRVQEIERLAAADLADDYPVWRHPQRLVDEHLDGDRALAFDVRRPAFQRNAVRKLAPQMQLGLILDGDDALVLAKQTRQHPHERGLTGAGAARHQTVQPSCYSRLEKRT